MVNRRQRSATKMLIERSIASFIITLALSHCVGAFLEQNPAKISSNKSTSGGGSQSISGNMSAMMTNLPQMSPMTNSSVVSSLVSMNKTSTDSIAKTATKTVAAQVNQVSKANNRPAPTNSPAFNSRQLKQNGSGRQRNDNQMAADDTQSAQTFMTISSASTSVSSSESDRSNAPNRPKTTTEASEQVVSKQSKVSSGETYQPKSSSVASTINRQTADYQPPPRQQQQQQWRPRVGGLKTSTQQQVAQYVEPPAIQQRYPAMQSQLSQMVDADSSLAQLERPAGYSYDSPGGYTHTSPLSPTRQEVQQVEQVSSGVRQRQPYYYERSPHSASIFDQVPRSPSPVTPVEQVNIGGKGAFTQQVLDPLYSGRAAQSSPPLRQPVHAPHHTITGTANNPCRSPANLDLMNSIQVANGELGSSAQVLPNFSPTPTKYLRLGVGLRLRSQYIFKVLRADSLTDCESACSKASAMAANNPSDTCRSFNYRAYFAAENCELSRLDSRSLKLDDGSQFEQHTQFDFYALPESVPVPMSASLMASGSSSSLAYSPLFPEADCLDVTQSCSQDGMEFTLRTNEPFNGRIYTYGFYDSCFTDSEGSRESSLRISRSNGFPRCGTQQIGDLMTNIVVVQFNDHVQTTRDKKYNLTCYFSGPAEAVVTSNYLDAKLDERSQPMQIEHLPPQNVITSNVHLRVLYRGQPTNTIAVGDLLTFRLESRATNQQQQQQSAQQRSNSGEPPASEIFATNVLAKDPYSGRQVQLIDARGCPIDPVNVFPELQRTPDGALESEFYAFKIPDSNFLIFQATVRTCRAPCEPVICQSSPPPPPLPPRSPVGPSSGIKGGVVGGGYLTQQSAAVLMPSSAPSWGRRRRRRRRREAGTGESAQFDDDDEVLAGESVEHVIPARMTGAQWSSSATDSRQVQTFRRPELAEAEEEVKDMFRVYLSRAEINRQRRFNQSQPTASLLSSDNGESPAEAELEEEKSRQVELAEPPEEVCVSQVAYYVLLLAVIVLSMLMLTLLCVALYLGKQAKVHISDSLADAMF